MPKVDDETLRQRCQQAKEAWGERQKTNRAKRRRETLFGKMVLHHVQG